MKRITNEPWFSERQIGWGWAPITWQGWVVTLILVLIIVLDTQYLIKNPIFFIIIFVLAVLGFSIVALLTGGKPGSKLLDQRKKNE